MLRYVPSQLINSVMIALIEIRTERMRSWGERYSEQRSSWEGVGTQLSGREQIMKQSPDLLEKSEEEVHTA